MTVRMLLAFPCLALGVLAPASRGQSVLYTFDGNSSADNFGVAVSGAGDVNGDGYDDLIVGAYLDDNNGMESGMARVFSGLDGSILYTFDGDSPGDVFGFSVSGAGDVNGDGFADLIVGAIFDDNNGLDSGSARVIISANTIPELTCNGFAPPFDQPLSLKKKVKRAIPVDMVLIGADGYMVTDADIVAPPVINVFFNAQVFGEIPPNTDDLLPLGSANDDNIFRFDPDSGQWIYNLGTKQFTAPGTYMVIVTSGDEPESTINAPGGQCYQTFTRQ